MKKNLFDFFPDYFKSYRTHFDRAVRYTKGQGFQLDSEIRDDDYLGQAQIIAEEIAKHIPDRLFQYQAIGLKALAAFGGDCGNTHYSILQFIQQYYPKVPANLTIGGIDLGASSSFDFSEQEFERWRTSRPEIFDCHAWITIGNRIILDATIMTYVNTRLRQTCAVGGVLVGEHKHFELHLIPDTDNVSPALVRWPVYRPVAIGVRAFKDIAPLA